ncbi:alkyl/aryl-sulfatase [Alienimonas chondri]|uniref:Alkyl/aryl-sulfatase YjcS n=1 Tax=Alienimonas chondri TaxID=2681879 RepID=A0ABX1VAA3_9PLAN|nr:alkyl/aryl-sulfatase [Alienimonas chondri]NNJ24308.1 putative alkyl/aryl-sulfatase YjcS [Alienimonas chondri]
MKRFVFVFAAGLLGLGGAAFAQTPRVDEPEAATAALRAQGEQFEEEIVTVSDGVFVAVGYSPANVGLIVGENGAVVIDTGMSVDDGRRIAAEFRKLTDKPVRAIVFTHSHGDHTGGAAAFLELADEKPQVWAHENFGSEARPLLAGGVSFQRVRGARQAGFMLPPEDRINNGVAPARYPKRGGNAFEAGREVKPSQFLAEESRTVEVGGVTIELVAAPGETNDELFVWHGASRTLFAGDNFYRSFPNLYAIRGTPNRSVRLWADSLDKMVDRDAAALVGGHTDPVLGEEQVREVLTDYRDAVQYIHDETVAGMNRGLTPDELAATVRLPERLANKEYLRPFYGHPEWGVRSVFAGYLGWFDGNPTNLFRLPPKEEAERFAKLAGGAENLRSAAREALEGGDGADAQWAAQLADRLLALDPEDQAAKNLKADALTQLARRSVTATARNYYLTVAQGLRGETDDAGAE